MVYTTKLPRRAASCGLVLACPVVRRVTPAGRRAGASIGRVVWTVGSVWVRRCPNIRQTSGAHSRSANSTKASRIRVWLVEMWKPVVQHMVFGARPRHLAGADVLRAVGPMGRAVGRPPSPRAGLGCQRCRRRRAGPSQPAQAWPHRWAVGWLGRWLFLRRLPRPSRELSYCFGRFQLRTLFAMRAVVALFCMDTATPATIIRPKLRRMATGRKRPKDTRDSTK